MSITCHFGRSLLKEGGVGVLRVSNLYKRRKDERISRPKSKSKIVKRMCRVHNPT